MECTFKWDKNIILERDVFISCHDSRRVYYIMMEFVCSGYY